MRLVVGLGNPGLEYNKTRHNVGFMFLDYMGYLFKLNKKFNALEYETIINNESVMIIKPLSFMNLSGDCVSKFVNYYNIDIEDILIIYDDINFDVGTYKIRRKGSAGGHNGLNNIIQNLQTEDIKRIKIGISKNTIPLIDYVLQKFSEEDYNKINNILKDVNRIIDDFISHDIDYLMEKYNGMKDE